MLQLLAKVGWRGKGFTRWPSNQKIIRLRYRVVASIGLVGQDRKLAKKEHSECRQKLLNWLPARSKVESDWANVEV